MDTIQTPRVLIMIRHYEPAFRFGGPIRSVTNLVSALRDEFDFRIICLNHDYRETSPLPDIEPGVWLARNGAQVCYLELSLRNPMPLFRTIRSIDFDALYLNSFFDPLFSILPALLMKLRFIKKKPIILAPRGEFSPGALALRNTKKRLFIRMQKYVDLYQGSLWQATTAKEIAEIKEEIGQALQIHCAENLSDVSTPRVTSRTRKANGSLKVVFLSRIAPMKNLLGLIQSLRSVRGAINLEIWGPLYDADYWKLCKAQLSALPGNIMATYRGEAERSLVPGILAEAELFALPTLGENFGHVIQEALANGCPVVISDRTPWRNLADHGVGFDVSLEDDVAFSRALQTFVDMTHEEYAAYADRCRAYALSCQSEDRVDASRRLFYRALGMS